MAAPKGIDKSSDTSVLLKAKLGFTCNSGRVIRWQGNGFIQGVGVQALCASKSCRHRLIAGSGHVGKGTLFSEAPP